MSDVWTPELEVEKNQFLISPKGIFFDALTSLTYSFAIYEVEEAYRHSGRELITDNSFFEIILAMSFGINSELNGFPNHLYNFYIAEKQKQVHDVIDKLDEITLSRPQTKKDLSLQALSIYKFLRERLPEFYADLGNDRDWYLEPFWNIKKMESSFLVGLAKGWLVFNHYFHDNFEFTKKDLLEKNLIKLLCLFFWLVDQYYQDFSGFQPKIRQVVAEDGILLLRKYASLSAENFNDAPGLNLLIREFTSIRFKSLYSHLL